MQEQSITSILQNVSFGIEIETCFHLLDHEEKNGEFARQYLYSCLSEKSLTANSDPRIEKSYIPKWDYISANKRADVYDRWYIMNDTSVHCDIDIISCLVKGTKAEKQECANKFPFHSVEIVTPKFTIGDRGFERLLYVWYGFLFSDNIIYTTNATQGLHINISHPQMNTRRFVSWWARYEPIIIQLLPDYRKSTINKFAVPILKQLCLDEMCWYSENIKYSAIKIHTQGNNRLEIRIGAGTIDFADAYFWCIFCCLFLSASILIGEDAPQDNLEYRKARSIIEQKTTDHAYLRRLFVELALFIPDNGVQVMILDRYNRYKFTGSPELYYNPTPYHIVDAPWITLSDRKQAEIDILRNIPCVNNIGILRRAENVPIRDEEDPLTQPIEDDVTTPVHPWRLGEDDNDDM